MGKLDNKHALITGAAGSIGWATARLFCDEGARVTLTDLDEQALAAACTRLPAARVQALPLDVTSAAAWRDAVAKATAAFGSLDVLFSNAGNSGAIAPVVDYPEEVFDRVLATHLRGAFLACKYGLPAMRDGGSLVICSSVAAFRGDPGASAYIAAKLGQVGLMRSVAREAAARRIRVNTVHPGPIRNEFQQDLERRLTGVLGRDATAFFDELIPLRRHGTPEEVARAVLFLASDDSSFTTASTLMVDGGMGP
ncbi:MAG TPA: SDR family NAD(P)-dependent oxidoreductase [Burkholderiaceae bacterium]|jgi:NAD(P)-dependent dehydrogenase (short-subunit alcohol dehydrogenase family)|nr:SDR family NAD(P)-dependent oxidoreductase [Burkholderiaceae bacterium]